MTFLRKSGSLVAVWIKSLAIISAWCYFCSGSRSHGMNFVTTYFMPTSCVKISDSDLESPDQLLVLILSVADLCWLQPVHVQQPQVFCFFQAFQNVDHFQQILDHLWTVCATFLFVLHSLYCLWKPSKSGVSNSFSPGATLALQLPSTGQM